MHSSIEIKSTTIPKKIHYIWVGGPIKKDYLANILEVAKLAQKSGFELNVWVDNEENIYRTLREMNPDTLEIPKSKKIMGIRLRNINELLSPMQKDDFFKEKDRYSEIRDIIRREMVGFKNLAAASDLLRYIILFLEGGYYVDTDIKFIIEKGMSQKFVEETLISGFKAAINIGQNLEFLQLFGGNDVIASIPQHPIIRETLSLSLDNYYKLDTTSITNVQSYNLRISDSLSQMDAKRWPYSDIGNGKDFYQGRRGLTINKAAGPSTLCKGIENFWGKYIKIEKNQNTLSKMVDSMEMRFYFNKTIGSVPVKIEGHRTWLVTPAKKAASFDTHSLLNETCFSLPTPSDKKKNTTSPWNREKTRLFGYPHTIAEMSLSDSGLSQFKIQKEKEKQQEKEMKEKVKIQEEKERQQKKEMKEKEKIESTLTKEERLFKFAKGEAPYLDCKMEDLDKILSTGINIDVRDQDGNTALILAAMNKKENVVFELLDRDANPNMEGAGRKTALMHVKYGMKSRMLQYQQSYGIKPTVLYRPEESPAIVKTEIIEPLKEIKPEVPTKPLESVSLPRSDAPHAVSEVVPAISVQDKPVLKNNRPLKPFFSNQKNNEEPYKPHSDGLLSRRGHRRVV